MPYRHFEQKKKICHFLLFVGGLFCEKSYFVEMPKTAFRVVASIALCNTKVPKIQ